VACAPTINEGVTAAIVPSTSTIAKKILPVSFIDTILFYIQTYHTYYICDRLDE